MNVTEFYGDGAFDTIDLFTLMHQIGAKPVIKIRKNDHEVMKKVFGEGFWKSSLD